jgi:hypothetical protein
MRPVVRHALLSKVGAVAKNRLTMLSQDAEVGMNCQWKRRCALSHRFTARFVRGIYRRSAKAVETKEEDFMAEKVPGWEVIATQPHKVPFWEMLVQPQATKG